MAAWLAAQRSENTRAAYQRDLAEWRRWLAPRRRLLLEVDRRLVDTWRDQLVRAGRSNTTVARKLTAVSSFYGFVSDEALAAGVVFANPAARVKRPEVDTVQGSTPRLGQAAREALLATAGPTWRDVVLVRLLLIAGLRVSEALAIMVDDVAAEPDGDGRTWRYVWVHRKRGRREKVTLDQGTATAVDRLVDELDGPGPLLRTSSGRPLDRSQAFRSIRRMATNAGLSDRTVSPHVLRVEFVTWALDAGAALRDVQDAAGHRDPRTTRRYDRARGQHARSPVHTLGAEADRLRPSSSA